MSRAKAIPVDYTKLAKELKKQGKDISTASCEMGFHESYLSHVSSRHELRKSSVVLLEKLFGIAYDAIKPDEPAQVMTATLEQVQDGVVETLKAINETLQQLNATMGTIQEQTARALDLVEPLKEPMALYKTIFMPIYAAVRAGEVDGAVDEEKKRRIDGTINMSGFKRREV